ncbi:MAG: right-handed parallel beta-helix repeat-containing protein [Bacteroidetes bacterium]|nr:right-handed parallel beta-helix repeat-containing protein [Bacteroidota bacterium]
MKNRYIILFAFCICLFVIHFVQAQNSISYYVSVKGKDTNPGTKAKPFKTIEKINGIHLKPGSFVFLEGGASFSGTLILNSDESGTKENPILISSYGKGIAQINGNLKEAILIKSNYLTIKNINVKGAGRKDGNTTNGIFVESANGVIIEKVITEGFQKSGIELNNCRNSQILKVYAKDNGFCGICVSGTRAKSRNILIKDCKADNNAGDPTNLTNHSGNGILVGCSDSVLIDHCTATNNGWDMPRKGNGPVGIWAYESDHVIIQYCIAYGNKTQEGASDGGGFDLDGGMTNSMIQYCLSYDNQGSGYGLFQYWGASKWVNNAVRYCISVNDGQKTSGAAGFLIWNSSTDSTDLSKGQVYNNFVYNDVVPAVRFDAQSKNSKFIFSNNIFIGKDEVVSGPTSGETFLGNIWWNVKGNTIKFRGYDNLADWANATGQEKLEGKIRGAQIDPLLKGPFITHIIDPYQLNSLAGFKLQNDSPVIDLGIDIKALYNIVNAPNDFYGNPSLIGSATEPGIHELK